jgi:holo-[acyl-carrier protein] synthase
VIPPSVQLPPHHVRVGCDLVALSEVEYSVSNFGQRYLDKMFTAAEQAHCEGVNQIARLATRFAAKEAVVKAFGEPGEPYPAHEIEVVSIGSVPSLRLAGSIARRAADQGWLDISVSLSHTDCHAAAIVVVVCSHGPVVAGIDRGGAGDAR